MSGTEGSTHPPSGGESGTNVEIGARLYGSINAELKVRIRFPPAASLRTIGSAAARMVVVSDLDAGDNTRGISNPIQ
jgi:hypothetical protein